jgi:hypothetical protein
VLGLSALCAAAVTNASGQPKHIAITATQGYLPRL